MNRKHVKSDMDSGLGSDEDRRSRTKEQKQLHNQQLLSGCFIDAASLSDDSEVVDQRRNDERRQGALLFQTSVPHFSMVQIPHDENFSFSSNNLNVPQFPETSTPYNSIVQLDSDEAARKSPLGFYVDLNDVSETPASLPNPTVKKNIFSMVIDFEGPKKEKPVKLSSSLISFRKPKPTNKSNLLGKSSGSLSSSVSSINSNRDSSSVAGTSRQSEELEIRTNGKGVSIEVLSASLIKNLSISSKSSSSSENVPEKNSDYNDKDSAKESVDEDQLECDSIPEHDKNSLDVQNGYGANNKEENQKPEISKPLIETLGNSNDIQTCPQFVKLSDLECQKPKVDLNFTPRMSRSIPESSWVESPLMMSHSVGYRSAPHPLEPEHEDNSDSENVEKKETPQPYNKSARKLGTDLLRMFLEEIGTDVVVEVDGHKLKAHKCILASRCQYFAALISGNWVEKNGNVISLEGFTYEAVYFSLCHIYSGAAHVPDSISLVELASLSDMLGLEGLKEVVEHALRQRHCHNFHKPCAGCCTGVLEVLPLTSAYGLDDLYRSCLQWITEHFVRVWPSRAFASLTRDLREKCFQQHVVHMNPEKVLDTMIACNSTLVQLPEVRWAEPIIQLVSQLTDACHLYHRQHFSAVLGSQYLLGLDAGLGLGVFQIEDQMLAAAKNLGVDQACRSYTRCCKMLDENWTRPFADMLNKVKLQLEQCLVDQADRLIRSNAWLRLDTNLRTRIKELSPHLEPTSRLPRSTMFRNKKSSNLKSNVQNPALSSSDSSRNSSPGINQQVRVNGTNGSPSLRRSLLLAAKAPQVPPSPSIHRRSTLTQPTAASAAKSAKGPVKVIPKTTVNRDKNAVNIKPPLHAPASKYSTSERSSSTVSRNSSMGKTDTLSSSSISSRNSNMAIKTQPLLHVSVPKSSKIPLSLSSSRCSNKGVKIKPPMHVPVPKTSTPKVFSSSTGSKSSTIKTKPPVHVPVPKSTYKISSSSKNSISSSMAVKKPPVHVLAPKAISKKTFSSTVSKSSNIAVKKPPVHVPAPKTIPKKTFSLTVSRSSNIAVKKPPVHVPAPKIMSKKTYSAIDSIRSNNAVKKKPSVNVPTPKNPVSKISPPLTNSRTSSMAVKKPSVHVPAPKTLPKKTYSSIDSRRSNCAGKTIPPVHVPASKTPAVKISPSSKDFRSSSMASKTKAPVHVTALKTPVVKISPSLGDFRSSSMASKTIPPAHVPAVVKMSLSETYSRSSSMAVKPPLHVPAPKPSTSRSYFSSTISRNSSMGKKDTPICVATKRSDSRSSSPLKSDSRNSSPRKVDSKITSPIKANVRSPSPLRDASNSPRRTTKEAKTVKYIQVPVMQRSTTFLKDEPTVIGCTCFVMMKNNSFIKSIEKFRQRVKERIRSLRRRSA